MNNNDDRFSAQVSPSSGSQKHFSAPSTQPSEQELDRLQIQWILGKNRGLENPLRPEEIRLLLLNGRISGKQSTEGENPLFDNQEKNSNGIVKDKEKEGGIKNINKSVKISAEDLIIYALQDAIVEFLIQRKFYTREQWEQKTEIQKATLLDAYCFGLLKIDLEDWSQQVRDRVRE